VRAARARGIRGSYGALMSSSRSGPWRTPFAKDGRELRGARTGASARADSMPQTCAVRVESSESSQRMRLAVCGATAASAARTARGLVARSAPRGRRCRQPGALMASSGHFGVCRVLGVPSRAGEVCAPREQPRGEGPAPGRIAPGGHEVQEVPASSPRLGRRAGAQQGKAMHASCAGGRAPRKASGACLMRRKGQLGLHVPGWHGRFRIGPSPIASRPRESSRESGGRFPGTVPSLGVGLPGGLREVEGGEPEALLHDGGDQGVGLHGNAVAPGVEDLGNQATTAMWGNAQRRPRGRDGTDQLLDGGEPSAPCAYHGPGRLSRAARCRGT